MPTYDYLCTNCGYKFEEFQKMTDDALSTCPTCKGKLKRLIGSGLGPIFKGSGFYQTDYKNSAVKEETKSKEIKKETKPSSSSKSDKKQNP